MIAATSRGMIGARNRAALAVCAFCACRVGELVQVRGVDVDLLAGTLAVLHGKGRSSRIVGVPPLAALLIGDWLRARVRLNIGVERPLFSSLRGEGLSTDAARAVVKRLAAKAGINRTVRPHGLRAFAAQSMVRQGVHIMAVSAALGHRNLNTTAIYLRGLGADAIPAMRRMEF